MFSVILHILQPSWNIYQSSDINVFYYFSDVAFFFYALLRIFTLYVAYLFFHFWLCHKAYGILVPWPEIEPTPPALEAQSPNHWTAREVPTYLFDTWLMYHHFLQKIFWFSLSRMMCSLPSWTSNVPGIPWWSRAMAQVQSLVGELRFSKPHDTAMGLFFF